MIENTETIFIDLVLGKIGVEEFKIGQGISIGNSFDYVPKNDIINVLVYELETNKIILNINELTFDERLSMLRSHTILICLVNGINLLIEKQKIVRIEIEEKYIQRIYNINRNTVEFERGKADFVMLDDALKFDENSIADSIVLVYGLLNLFFEPDKMMLKSVVIGEVNFKFYSIEDISYLNENNLQNDYNETFKTDWTNYNDNLDMDQQSDEFWNQF